MNLHAGLKDRSDDVTRLEKKDGARRGLKCPIYSVFNIIFCDLSFARQHWAAIGCTSNCQPITVTVHSNVLGR